MDDIRFNEYSKTLPIAREIYKAVYPEHTTHVQWAESFNKIGDINRIIIKHI